MIVPRTDENRLPVIIQAIRKLAEGRQNAHGTVTLTTGATTTTVSNQIVAPEDVILLSPTNADAAGEVGAGTIYVSAVAKGEFTLTHANAGTTRTFGYVVIGG